jgi:hypothetical protein
MRRGTEDGDENGNEYERRRGVHPMASPAKRGLRRYRERGYPRRETLS